jgi:hypothetical protein
MIEFQEFKIDNKLYSNINYKINLEINNFENDLLNSINDIINQRINIIETTENLLIEEININKISKINKEKKEIDSLKTEIGILTSEKLKYDIQIKNINDELNNLNSKIKKFNSIQDVLNIYLNEIEELKNLREVLISNIKKSNEENNQLINNFLDSIANSNFEPNKSNRLEEFKKSELKKFLFNYINENYDYNINYLSKKNSDKLIIDNSQFKMIEPESVKRYNILENQVDKLKNLLETLEKIEKLNLINSFKEKILEGKSSGVEEYKNFDIDKNGFIIYKK